MSEWIEWDRKGMPVDAGIRVDVRLSDGQEMFNRLASDFAWRPSTSWISFYRHADIETYRVSEQKSMEEAYDETTRGINTDMDEPSALTKQYGGDHYTDLGDYQPWKVLQQWLTPEEFRGYMKGNAITYLARERSKGGTLDVSKAAHTLDALIELEGK